MYIGRRTATASLRHVPLAGRLADIDGLRCFGAPLKGTTTALDEPRRAHRGPTFFCYLDVSLDETVHRQDTRPPAVEFTPDQMRSWYRAEDI
jgi:hypothetical protein